MEKITISVIFKIDSFRQVIFVVVQVFEKGDLSVSKPSQIRYMLPTCKREGHALN